jgi:hypothetical protein
MVCRGIPSGSSLRLQCWSDYYTSQNYCNFCADVNCPNPKQPLLYFAKKNEGIVSMLKWIMCVVLYGLLYIFGGFLQGSMIQTGISLYCSEDPESIEWHIEDQWARPATHRTTEKERQLTEGSWGGSGWTRSRITRPQISLILYKSVNTLWEHLSVFLIALAMEEF